MTLLENLNLAQREAVEYNEGPLMILAGAGSGKTRTLVAKICYLLNEKNFSPYQILAVTFSNKAAKEMRDRVSVETKQDYRMFQITTFHSLCAQILRKEAGFIGLSQNFTIYDDSESKSIAKSILAKYGISKKEMTPKDLLYYVSELKNQGYHRGKKECVEDFDIDTSDRMFNFYEDYERELHRSNAVDFGGLITGVIELFETHPEVLKRYQQKYSYILVDEYQDTNRAQFQLISLLSSDSSTICVVGDEDQSIYSWRGADIRNIIDFEESFPNSRLIKLEQNYRSSKIIIEAASSVIARNEMRKGKTMWTDNIEGEPINIVECSDDRDEAEFVCQKIQDIKSEGESLSDIAVFYRNNSQSRLIEDGLRKSNIGYRIIGGIKFYERKEIKDALGYLRILINPQDSLALTRIINTPSRGIGPTTLRKFEDEAIKLNLSLYEMMETYFKNPEDYSHIRINRKAKAALGELISLIDETKILVEAKEAPSVIYEKVIEESGYLDQLKQSKDYESMARIENLEELGNAIVQFEIDQDIPTLSGFLETITLDASKDEVSADGEVSLMTVHGSKGLEFPFVFVVGVEENLFPSFRSLENGTHGIEEERRLFYVAMTRAMKSLWICFAQARMLFGSVKFNGPSTFIHEIPNKFYQWVKIGKAKSNSSNYQDEDFDFNQDVYSDDEFDQTSDINHSTPKVQRKVKQDSTFPKGSLVVHGLYGEGQVLSSEGSGKDEKVMIKFNDGTRKKFMVQFAPLSLL